MRGYRAHCLLCLGFAVARRFSFMKYSIIQLRRKSPKLGYSFRFVWETVLSDSLESCDDSALLSPTFLLVHDISFANHRSIGAPY